MSVVAKQQQQEEAARFQRAERASLALEQIIKPFRESKSAKILDLGRPSEANVAFYSTFAKKIQFEDLCGAVVQPRLSSSPDRYSDLLGLPEGVKFDLIMCWDLLDYVPANELAFVGERLRSYTHAGTTLFALLSLQKQIPESPQRFKIMTPTRIACEETSQSYVPALRHTKAVLQKHFTPFERVRSFLLRHGVEEHIFKVRPAPASEELKA